MPAIMERVRNLFDRKDASVVPLDEVTPTMLANDPLMTVQLSEEQTARLDEIEANGPAAS